jgi:hypothetical protein
MPCLQHFIITVNYGTELCKNTSTVTSHYSSVSNKRFSLKYLHSDLFTFITVTSERFYQLYDYLNAIRSSKLTTDFVPLYALLALGLGSWITLVMYFNFLSELYYYIAVMNTL